MNIHPFPRVIAHRGASGYAPENTLAAMKKAHELGIDWVEFDVMLSRDGEPIIIHDTCLERTTSGKGKVADNDLLTITALDAGSWFDTAFFKERVPTLKEMLSCLKQNSLHAIVEIKSCSKFEALTAEKTYEVLVNHWGDALENTIISSFSIKSLQKLRHLAPKQKLGLGIHHWRKRYLDLITELDCASIHINHRVLSLQRMDILKKYKKLVLSYTINDRSRAEQLFEWGVDGVFSDYPDRMLSVIS